MPQSHARATGSARLMTFSKRLLPAALAFLLTNFPREFFVMSLFVIPPAVFAFVPRNTTDFAYLPRAILDTRFIAFMAFIAARIAFAMLRKREFAGERSGDVVALVDTIL